MSAYDENERSNVKEIDVTRRQDYRTGKQIDDAEAWLRANDPAYAESKRGWIARKTDALARSRETHGTLHGLQPTGKPGDGNYRPGLAARVDPDTPFGQPPAGRAERNGISDATRPDGELVDSLHFGDAIEDVERLVDAEPADVDDVEDDAIELGAQAEALADDDDYPGDKLPARSRSHWRDEARRLRASGWSYRKISKHLGVSLEPVYRAVNGQPNAKGVT